MSGPACDVLGGHFYDLQGRCVYCLNLRSEPLPDKKKGPRVGRVRRVAGGILGGLQNATQPGPRDLAETGNRAASDSWLRGGRSD